MRVSSTIFSGLILMALAFSFSLFAITFDTDVSGVNGFTSVDKISWTDSKGWLREVYFAKTHPGKTGAKCYITRMTWKADASTTITCNEPNPTAAMSGFGFGVDNHEIYWSRSKDAGSGFTQATQFAGEHHFMYRTAYTLASISDGPFKVIVDWTFYDGLDYFLFPVTLDCSSHPTMAYPEPEPRIPYSVFDWDGDGVVTEDISGMAYGTEKKFLCPAMTNYTYGGTNMIPYAWEWKTPADRECGFVQTQTQTQHTSGVGAAAGDFCPSTGTLSGFEQANPWQLSYWMNAKATVPFKGNDISWRTPYGSVNGGQDKSTAPYSNYTVAMLVDKKSENGVSDLIIETEYIQRNKFTFTVTTGTAATSGKEGCANPTIKTYSPVGFNHVYRCWELSADGNNAAAFTLNCLTDTIIKNPVILLDNYTLSTAPALVSLNAASLVSGTDYYASVDNANNRLFLTILKPLSRSNSFGINTSSSARVFNTTIKDFHQPINADIYTVKGELVKAAKVDVKKSIPAQSLAARLASGAYVVKLQNNSREIARKLIR
jgi:hypothetical protein